MRHIVLTAIVLVAGCASNGHGSVDPAPPHTRTSGHTASNHGAVGVEVVFSDEEIRTIRAYYESHVVDSGIRRGNGKSKSRGLPPGIAKNLARGKPLPPGIAQQELPADLRRQLPLPPRGYERIVVAGKILLVEIATQIVRDVLKDAMLG